MTDIPDIFAGCEIDEILAITLDQEGLEGLKALLAQVDLDREALMSAADKLEQASLIEGANIVREASLKAPTRSSQEIARVLADEDVIRQRAYLAELYRKGQIILADLAGIDPTTVSFVEKSRYQWRDPRGAFPKAGRQQ